MRVKVKYFAVLRELLGVGEEEYEVEGGTRLLDLLQLYIPERHKHVAGILKDQLHRILGDDGSPGYIVIVNGKRVDPNEVLRDGDVVAILPPVGGG